MKPRSPAETKVRSLHRQRPRSRFLRGTALLLGACTISSLCFSEIDLLSLFQANRRSNLARFLREEVVPYPLREEGFDLGRLGRWVTERWTEHGAEAFLATLSIAVLGIVLAALFALPFVPFASRNLMASEPFSEVPNRSSIPARAVVAAVRAFLVVVRAIPDYVLAFLLVSILGVSAWPAVIALALHNGSILGRLGADTVENLPRGPGVALRGLGASRAQLFLAYAWPQSLPRFLLYFFYRFENCVRDATVLGMLGVISLGYWVEDARVRLYYDDLLLYLVWSAGLVLLGDLSSVAARAALGRAVR